MSAGERPREPADPLEPRETLDGEACLAAFGRVDVYVFDQLARGNITPRMRVLDAGCGGGRNVEFLLRCGADVHGVDSDPAAIARVRELAARLAPHPAPHPAPHSAPRRAPDHGLDAGRPAVTDPAERFVVARVEDLPHPDGHFGAVLCNAVLHFAPDERTWRAMVDELWRVLAPGGVLFTRLASTLGVEHLVTRREGRWHRLPDGTDRFLVDAELLQATAAELGAEPVDQLKTTVVHGLRAMTTWVLRKRRGTPAGSGPHHRANRPSHPLTEPTPCRPARSPSSPSR